MSSGTVFVFGLNTWMTDKWTKTIMFFFLSHHICKVRIRLHCSILIIWLSLSLLPGAGREHRQQMKPSSELFFPFAIIFKAFTIFISWSLQILCLFVCWSVVLNHIKLIRSQQGLNNWFNLSMHQELVQPGGTEWQVEGLQGNLRRSTPDRKQHRTQPW